MEALYKSEWKQYPNNQYRRVSISDTVKHRRSWTEEEKQYLRDNYVDKHSYYAIATHLKRTILSVEVMMYKLRIRVKQPKKVYVPRQAPWITNRMNRMQELISFIQYVSRVAPEKTYLIETAKTELKKLSGL